MEVFVGKIEHLGFSEEDLPIKKGFPGIFVRISWDMLNN